MVEQQMRAPIHSVEAIAAAVASFVQALDYLGYEEVDGYHIAEFLGITEEDVRAVVRDFEMHEGVHINV